ncbi:MAG: YXWGXW repeat-containing protein [Bacteroidetes bacterium]|nr:YXWGXW repeat-containing protein [Bacteroidota bacterium]
MKCKAFANAIEKSIMGVSKKYVFLAMMLVGAGSFSAAAQVYVTVRPAWHRVERRPAGVRGNVWIEEDWAYRDGRYVAVGGHWATPPHPGWVWIPGRWVHERRGWQWIPGRWRRR